WTEPGLAAAQVEQRDERLDEDILDADLLELGLVGCGQLLVGRLAWRLLAHAAVTPAAYVARVSRTVSAKTSCIATPSAISARWRWAPLRSGSTTSSPCSARTGSVHASSRSTAAAVGYSARASKSITLPSSP